MALYRKKPVLVDAVQWRDDNFDEIKKFTQPFNVFQVVPEAWLYVHKARAMAEIEVGDWVLREPDGAGFYPCKRDVFEATYEAVEWADYRTALEDILASIKRETDGSTCLWFGDPANCATRQLEGDRRCPGCIAAAALAEGS